MIRHARNAAQQIGLYIEEIILLALIILNILDFMEILPPFWDFIKKIISWTVLGFLLYKVSLTKIFFGEKHERFDFWIVMAYFVLITKNFIEYIVVARRSLLDNIGSHVGFAIVDKSTAALYGFKDIAVEGLHNLNQSLMVPLGAANSIMTEFPQHLSLLNPEMFFRLHNPGSEMFVSLGPKTLDGALLPLYNTLFTNKGLIESYSFYIGIGMLLLLAIIMSHKVLTRKNSLFYAITQFQESREDREIERIIKTIVVFGILLFFFIIVFNLMMEWLAIAIDAPLLMIGLVAYPFFLHKHHKKFDTDSFIFKIGDFGSDFYTKFIDLFHTRKGMMLGVSGMLVLHLLTDVGNYVVPYIISVHDQLYLSRFEDSMHTPIIRLIELSIQQLNLTQLIDILATAFMYIINTIGLLFLLIFPAYLWYKMLVKEQLDEDSVSGWLIAMFYPAVIAMIAWPVFKITSLSTSSLIGVNIISHTISFGNMFLVRQIAFALIVLFLLIWLLTRWKIAKRLLLLPPVIGAIGFFGFYLYHYLASCFLYYMTQAGALYSMHDIFTGTMLYAFLGINIMFYIGGFLVFCYKAIVEEEESIEEEV